MGLSMKLWLKELLWKLSFRRGRRCRRRGVVIGDVHGDTPHVHQEVNPGVMDVNEFCVVVLVLEPIDS